MKKVLGMVGGMGPLASAHLYQRIVELTQALHDQDHIPIIIDSQPTIPDRTAYLLGKGEDPFLMLLASCKRLEKAGVDAIILACNTAHHWIEPLEKQLTIPIIHMIKEVVLEVKANPFLWDGLGILGTEGLKHFASYAFFLEQAQIPCLQTTPLQQQTINEIIYGVKANGMRQSYLFQLACLIEELKEQGWKHFILGCTELASLQSHLGSKTSFINSIDILAKHTILQLGYSLKGTL